MPANVIKTAKDKERWTECKKSVHKAHPKLSEDSTRFYKMVMGCFQKRKSSPNESSVNKEFEDYISYRRKAKHQKLGA